MTAAEVKLFFRNVIKVVAGGPAVGTPGQNRAAGVLAALDKLTDFVAELAGAASGYTDPQARAAQVERTAPAGTSTVTLTAEGYRSYPTLTTGAFTIDCTGCQEDVAVHFVVGADAGEPQFTNVPNDKQLKFLARCAYVANIENSYTVAVCADRIEVAILLG